MRVDDAISGNITIGRFGGVEVRVNWGLFVVVFALIVWSSADGVFPSRNPGLSHGVHLAMVLVAAALFFASVLLHELGHVSPLHDLPGSGGGQAGWPARLRLGRRPPSVFLGYATSAGHDDLDRPSPTARRGGEGRGRARRPLRAERESWPRGRERIPWGLLSITDLARALEVGGRRSD